MRSRSDGAGTVEPVYDFVYLDGAKHWTIDGLAVVLVEKLLRPGGWLLMDDLGWTYADDPAREATDGVAHRDRDADGDARALGRRDRPRRRAAPPAGRLQRPQRG